MVAREIYLILERVMLRSTLVLIGGVIAYFLLTLGFSSIRNLTQRMRRKRKWNILLVLYRYLLDEIPLSEIRCRGPKRSCLIDGFRSVISTIKGRGQERIKAAVKELGLISYVERGMVNLLPSRRMRSIYTLGIIGSKRSIPIITSKLYDFNPKVCSSAIIALGEIKDISTAPMLLEFYKNCSLTHAWLVAAILPFFGSTVYKAIRPLFYDPSVNTNKLILLIKVAMSFRLTESLRDLTILYKKSKNIDVRINALLAIGKINDLITVKTIIDALKDDAWEIRAVACNIIGEMIIKGATQKLVELLGDGSWFVRRNAAAALIKLGKIGVAALIDALRTDDRYARDMVVQTLQENGIVDYIVKTLVDKDEQKRSNSAKIIQFLAARGYRKFLDNYRESNPVVDSILTEVG